MKDWLLKKSYALLMIFAHGLFLIWRSETSFFLRVWISFETDFTYPIYENLCATVDVAQFLFQRNQYIPNTIKFYRNFFIKITLQWVGSYVCSWWLDFCIKSNYNLGIFFYIGANVYDGWTPRYLCISIYCLTRLVYM